MIPNNTFDKDQYISDILKNISRESEWLPFLASADALDQTQTGYKAIYKRVGTAGVGDYYNQGKNDYRVTNKDSNSFVQNIVIEVNIQKSSEMYYSGPEYAGFNNPDDIFDKQKAKQQKDWMRMRDLEVLTLITKGGSTDEKVNIVPVDASAFSDGKKIRKYISSQALKFKRKGLITEDNEHVGINASDIVIAIAPQQFSLVIEDYATIDSSTTDLRNDIRATKIDGILVYENLYLDSELQGDTDNTWMVMAVKQRLALPTAIQDTYDNKVFKNDHIVGLTGVMGKGILDGSLVTRYKHIPGQQPEASQKNKNEESDAELKEKFQKQIKEIILKIKKVEQEKDNLKTLVEKQEKEINELKKPKPTN